MKRVSAVTIISMVLVLAALSAAHTTDYDFTGVGDGAGTIPQGISNDFVVGSYADADDHHHAFTLTWGYVYTYFDCQDALLTDAIGISNAGTIVGTYLGSDRHYHGFIRSGTDCVPFDISGAYSTIVTGINNAGTIVGYYQLQDNGTRHGFVLNGTDYYAIDYPGANSYGTVAHGINDAGTVVGWYNGGNGRGFKVTGPDYKPQDYKPIDYSSGAVTRPYGINNRGTIAGWYNNGNGDHGFTLRGTHYETIDHDWASWAGYYTYIFGINDADWIVGSFGALMNVPFLGTPKDVTLSGTVTTDYCTESTCTINPFPDVVIDVTSDDNKISLQVTTASDGTYSVQVPPNITYTLTPSSPNNDDFDPSSLPITPTASVSGLDFSACVDEPPAGRGVKMAFQAASATPFAKPAPNKCDPDGIDWKMPKRLIKGKDFDDRAYGGVDGVVGHNVIYPSGGWTVNLGLTKIGKDGKTKWMKTCGDKRFVEWRWEASPSNMLVDKIKPGCTTSMVVKELGKYKVIARKYTRRSTSVDWTYSGFSLPPKTVIARDFLIVGLGDSNGSGEGNPPFFYPKCSRSQASYQFQSALAVQKNDHASVTFLWPSCSGSRIEHIYTMSYKGTIPEEYGALDPQIMQVTKLLTLNGSVGEPKKPRKVDAVILSTGVNNLYFGSLVEFCVKSPVHACQDLFARLDPKKSKTAGALDKVFVADSTSKTTVANLIAGLQGQLDNRYVPLAKALSSTMKKGGKGGLGVAEGHVIISQYPDFTHDGNGVICDTSWAVSAPQWDSSTWAWLRTQTDLLNFHVLNTEGLTWQAAKVNQGVFLYHGYCAGTYKAVPVPLPAFAPSQAGRIMIVPTYGESYFRGVVEGLPIIGSGNDTGGFHPLPTGHEITKNAVVPILCNILYGNDTCDGDPK